MFFGGGFEELARGIVRELWSLARKCSAASIFHLDARDSKKIEILSEHGEQRTERSDGEQVQ